MTKHKQNEIVEAHERRWRRWIAGRCYCTYPVPVSDPSRRPAHCAQCGGYIPAPVPVIDIDAETERIAELERENRVLRVAFLVMTAIAAVAVYLYDKAVTTISGGMP
jgi:hypothetical protein